MEVRKWRIDSKDTNLIMDLGIWIVLLLPIPIPIPSSTPPLKVMARDQRESGFRCHVTFVWRGPSRNHDFTSNQPKFPPNSTGVIAYPHQSKNLPLPSGHLSNVKPQLASAIEGHNSDPRPLHKGRQGGPLPSMDLVGPSLHQPWWVRLSLHLPS